MQEAWSGWYPDSGGATLYVEGLEGGTYTDCHLYENMSRENGGTTFRALGY